MGPELAVPVRLLPPDLAAHDHQVRRARGRRERAYEGRYEVRGAHIDYWDDTGFTADGDFRDGVLHHAGMVLRRA